jgi:hypothetical protein
MGGLLEAKIRDTLGSQTLKVSVTSWRDIESRVTVMQAASRVVEFTAEPGLLTSAK